MSLFSAFFLLLLSTAVAVGQSVDPVPSTMIESPLELLSVPMTEGAVAVSVDPTLEARLLATDHCTLREVPLPGGRRVDLPLSRVEVFTEDARIELVSVQKGIERIRSIPVPESTVYAGRVDGEDESFVVLGIHDGRWQGVIETATKKWIISSGPLGSDLPTMITDMESPAADQITLSPFSCEVRETPLGRSMGDLPSTPLNAGDTTCRTVEVAIETDAEFLNLFGGDVMDATAYATLLIGATSEIYHRDVNTTMVIPYLRLWETDEDPWTGEGAGDQLGEFRDHWVENMVHIERDLAHFLSGRGLGGGVAWLSVICSSYGYAVSGNLGGYFPYPIEHNHHQNWDLMVVAHELGHNFGSLHTHDGYDPVIDGCGNGDCTDANLGTIMSYCHTCEGGMSNVRMELHPRVQEVIEAYVAGRACLGDGELIVARTDRVGVIRGGRIDIDVIANDNGADCSALTLESFDAVSNQGGTVTLLVGDPRPLLQYTGVAGESESDYFTYTIRDGADQVEVGLVIIDPYPGRPADHVAASEPGVGVAYYLLDNPTDVPDFDAMSPYWFGLLETIDHPASGDEFLGSGRTTEVGAVFRGLLDVPISDAYTIYLETDDGSHLYVGDDLVIDNGGMHGMREESGRIELETGLHHVRIDYFQRFGAAGAIVRIEGGGLSKQIIPSTMWRHEVASAPGDANGDGSVNIEDLLIVIDGWGACPDPPAICAGDVTSDGSVNIQDLLLVIEHWGQ
jgi:hypothetical protein